MRAFLRGAAAVWLAAAAMALGALPATAGSPQQRITEYGEVRCPTLVSGEVTACTGSSA